MNLLITGGAGFIGSHLVEKMAERGNIVTVLDNLSTGSKRNLANATKNYDIEFLKGDCRNPVDIRHAIKGMDVVFHFAANPEVRLNLTDPKECYEHNVKATFVLLEEIKKSQLETIVFASSSTVYGDAALIPTPVDYGHLMPISIYGASKLAGEALVTSYCKSFKKRGIILRLANIIGPRSSRGVVYDFVKKLKANPSELEILGDGTQTKSYLYIDDCIEAILKIFESKGENTLIYNIGSDDQVSVNEIARIIIRELGVENVRLRYQGGVDGGRGWVGDVKNMLLETRKVKALGWKPKRNSAEAVKKFAEILGNQKL